MSGVASRGALPRSGDQAKVGTSVTPGATITGTATSVTAGEDDAQALEEIIELGLSTGRIRGVYGPEGEQAALKTYRKLPRGKELSESTRDVTGALGALEGKTLEHVKVQAAGPGAYLLSIGVEGLDLTVRLDRSGARLHSVGV